MKKILSLVLAGLLLIGLAGCSGVLHDIPNPNDMVGNWFYLEVDTSACPTETINIIFNGPAGTAQSSDIKDVQKTGQIYYVWESKGGTATVSERTDQPDKGIGNSTDKLGVYVFSNASAVNFYAWDSGASSTWWADGTAAGATAANWPGVAMNTDAEIVVEKAILTLNVNIVGATEGDKFYMDGDPWNWSNGWPIAAWGDAERAQACIDANKHFSTVADDTGACKIVSTIEVEKGVTPTGVIQIIKYLDPGDGSGLWGAGTKENPVLSGKVSPVWPAVNSDMTFDITVDVSSGTPTLSK